MPKDIPVPDEFNDRKNYENERRLLLLENKRFDLGTEVTGTLGTANGGTGADLSGAADYSLFYIENGVFVPLGPGTDGQVLTTSGTLSAPAWEAGGQAQIFTMDGSYAVPAGVRSVNISGCGGGGGGAGGGNVGNPEGGGGGGAGQCAFKHPWPTTPGNIVNVLVGAPGSGGVGYSDGNDGGMTVFGTFQLSGGNHGNASSSSVGLGGAAIALPTHSYDGDDAVGATLGIGGTIGLDQDFMVLTGKGGDTPASGGSGAAGGGGGGTPYGPGGSGGASAAGEDACSSCFGAGGGGGSSISFDGGDGAQGIIIIEPNQEG